MSAFRAPHPPAFVEIGHQALAILVGEATLELPLSRTASGRISPQSADALGAQIREFLDRQGARPTHAFCAIGARGVSLRHMKVPSGSRDDLDRVLALQIEREFPLPPAELSWGWQRIDRESAPSNGSPGSDSLLVAAVKRDVLQDYAELLGKCGLETTFTVGALGRASLAENVPGSCALLDIGETQSELISIENGVPASIRIVPWGRQHVVHAVQGTAALSEADAQKQLGDGEGSTGAPGPAARAGIAAACANLGVVLDAKALGKRVYVTGDSTFVSRIAPHLVHAAAAGVEFAPIATAGRGRTAAIEGLKRLCDGGNRIPPLVLRTGTVLAPKPAVGRNRWRWAALAAALALAAVALRYADVIIHKPRLDRRMVELKAYRDNLPAIEKELSFLQHLKTNQPPYLALFAAMAEAAPPGSRMESLSVTRSGTFSARATMRDAQQVADFRSKLIKGGWFSSLVVDDQTTTPDRQKVNVRLTGQWNPLATPVSMPPPPTSTRSERPDRTATNAPPRAPEPNT